MKKWFIIGTVLIIIMLLICLLIVNIADERIDPRENATLVLSQIEEGALIEGEALIQGGARYE